MGTYPTIVEDEGYLCVIVRARAFGARVNYCLGKLLKKLVLYARLEMLRNGEMIF